MHCDRLLTLIKAGEARLCVGTSSWVNGSTSQVPESSKWGVMWKVPKGYFTQRARSCCHITSLPISIALPICADIELEPVGEASGLDLRHRGGLGIKQVFASFAGCLGQG